MSVRERIIEEATAMIATQGVKSVRMDDIATQMGISKRTIYETFGDKENLVIACIKFFFQQKHTQSCRKRDDAKNIIEELMVALNSDDDTIQRSIALMADLKKFYPKIHRQIQDESFENGTREIRELLHRGVEQGIFIRHMDTELTVTVFIDLMQAMLQRANSITPVRDVSMPDMMRFCVILFVRGIATRYGIEQIDEYLMTKYKVNSI